MLDRVVVENAVRAADWANGASKLAEASLAAVDESEHWRLGAMAACAHVLGQATGRDAAAQLRELVRLADGHIHLPASLLKGIDQALFADFALTQRADASGRVLLELSPGHPVFEGVPDLRWALPIEPRLRRNTFAEPASSFLRRLSPYARFASDGQKAALHALMMMPAGATLVAALPTGWGKSALFQVGVRRWRETDATACVVVIVPTVALAQDHARTLASMPGLSGSRALVGGMKQSVRHETLEAFSIGDVPILLMSPEMALGGAFNTLCEAATRGGQGHDGGHLAAVVVDEAHIIASWGRHFRPDFQRLPGLVQDLRIRQPGLRTLLLSATIDDDLRQRLRADFSGTGATEEVVVAEPREEFDLVWTHFPAGIDRTRLVLQAADVIPRPAIIYTTTVEDAEKLHARLREQGYRRLDLFTGDIDDPAERRQVLDSWARGDTDLVVATSAFGMGVDKANVRAIVHACLPESAERLYQEIGRGGRDGHQALSLCLWTDGDASTAASLAIRGWMLPETSTRRWRAILEEAMKAMAVHDGSLFEETYNLLNAWLTIVPGNSAHNLRRLALLETNVADLSFLFTLNRGERISPHLRREALATFETPHHTAYAFNLHVQDVGHTLVLGATGSGKSFLLNFLATHAQKYDPLTVILDLGRSYHKLATLLQGRYLEIGLRHHEVTINPFALDPTPEHLHFLHAFVRVLLEGDDGYRLSEFEDREVYEAVENLYVLDRSQRRLFTLANLLPRALAGRLHKWIEGGRYAALFDNLDDTLTVERVQVFDFEAMRAYRYILEDRQIDEDIKRVKNSLAEAPEVIVISTADYREHCGPPAPWINWFAESAEEMAHEYNSDLENYLDARQVTYTVRRARGDGWAARRHQIEAVERWYLHGWSRLDNRLRSSITEGIVVFLSLFDDNPAVHRTFCPPRTAYMGEPKPGEPKPLPPIDELLESGHVLALNFPVAMNPGLARILGVMLKLDFQRAVLQRIPRIAAQPKRAWRDLLFVCDEYHAFATVGETDPTGDERTFALSRQARLIPIVATQSISSLRSALPGDESWRTLLQCFRTKLFLATSDEFTARIASELCGKRDRLKAHYLLSESGADAHISLLTGRAAANKQTLTASKSYTPYHEYVFTSRVFTELQNAQAVALPYDGFNPLPAQRCYLKPYYLDVQKSYFDHVAEGAL